MMSMLATQERLLAERPGFRQIGGDAKGAVAIEYGLIAALIVIAIIGVLGDVRDALVGLPLSTLINALAAAVS